MAKIDYLIPIQNHQKVRDKIGVILADELKNQVTLGQTDLENVAVGVGRTRPVDISEMPYYNVTIGQINYENQHQGYTEGRVLYNIDIYATKKSDGDLGGDEQVTTLLNNLIGIGRVILENPIYKNLEFPGKIGWVHFNTVDYGVPSTKDGGVTAMARMIYEVKMEETVELLDGVPIAQWQTQVYLDMTDKGYLWRNFRETTNLVAFDGSNLVAFDGSNLIGLQ